MEQWEQHKKTAVSQSLLSFILNDLRLKVSEWHVKLKRSKYSTQNYSVEPKDSSQTKIHKRNASTQIKESNINATQTDENEEKKDKGEQFTEQQTMNIGTSGETPYAVSMVFGQ